MLNRRHGEDCPAEDCAGCMPCPWPHCRRCSKEHAEHICPGCLADARETLAEIARLCADLPAEAEAKGVESEAMNLLGPVADPERTGHLRASINVGRVPADWLEVADNELHPLLVLGTWMEAYIEAFDHSEPARITVAGAASYLERNLAYAATFADVPFEDFARDLNACRTHLERVLHDGEQVETGAPCLKCRDVRLVRTRTTGAEDRWSCPRCKRHSTDAQYRLAVEQEFIERAEWLHLDHMAIRTNGQVSRGSVTGWASKGEVGKRTQDGRVVYRVADVLAKAGLADGDTDSAA